MQSLRVAAVSLNSLLGAVEQNLALIDRWAQEAAAAGADLALFPELMVHGHCTPNTWELAEVVPDGPSTRRIEQIATRRQLYLSVGLSEKDRDIVYNTQILVGPQGYLGKQRKLHLSRDETLFYKGGKELPVFDIGKAKLGTIICYDNQFPEVARVLALRGADILLMPHAAREGRWSLDDPASMAAARRKVFDYFVSCYAQRARENACFCVLADQAGQAGYVPTYPKEHPNQPHHPGAAIIFGPGGEILSHGTTDKIADEMIVHTLDPAELARQRALPNYTLRTRRPELYGELVRDQVSC